MSLSASQSAALDAILDGKTDAEAAAAARATAVQVRQWKTTKRWTEEYRARMSKRAHKPPGEAGAASSIAGSRTLGIEHLRAILTPMRGSTPENPVYAAPLEIRIQAAAHLAKLPPDPPENPPEFPVPATDLEEAEGRWRRLGRYLSMGNNTAALAKLEDQLKTAWLDVRAARAPTEKKKRTADEVLADLEAMIAECPAGMLEHLAEMIERRRA